jgi:hypothetical protein
LKICTEHDYLQAHLTTIYKESRAANSTLRIIKESVVSALMTLVDSIIEGRKPSS